jgi:NAD(P)-dependent dehydrogenase (short-subunit alcohol dehydrogenase family)
VTAVALVTGAGGGIGGAIARALAERGDVVHLNDRDAAAVAAVAASIRGETHAAIADVSDPDAVTTMVDAVVARHGRLDTLVTSAAISGADVLEDVLDVTPELWRRVIGIDLDGVFFCAQAAARAMAAGDGGTIVNIASVSGLVAEPRAAAYCAAKAGVIGLTRAMALDLAPAGVRVCAVAPGDIATVASDAAVAAQTAPYERGTPLGRRGTPEDVAAMVRFLSGPEASFVTGTTMVVDGGLLAS